MELLLQADCDFILEDGKLTAVDQRSFFVDKYNTPRKKTNKKMLKYKKN